MLELINKEIFERVYCVNSFEPFWGMSSEKCGIMKFGDLTPRKQYISDKSLSHILTRICRRDVTVNATSGAILFSDEYFSSKERDIKNYNIFKDLFFQNTEGKNATLSTKAAYQELIEFLEDWNPQKHRSWVASY